MADLTITGTSVLPGTGTGKTLGNAGVAITAGQTVYFDATSNSWKLADCNSATVAQRVAGGIALNGAAAGQPVEVQQTGPITIGATLTPGVMYYLSATPGGICPVADMVTGCYPCALGFAISATQLQLNIQSAGVSL